MEVGERTDEIRLLMAEENLSPEFVYALEKLLRRYDYMVHSQKFLERHTSTVKSYYEHKAKQLDKLKSKLSTTIHNQRAEIRRLLSEREAS